MKKSTLYSIIGTAALTLSTALTLVVSSVTATTPQNTTSQMVATTTDLAPTPTTLNSKNETVYIITDGAGTTTKSFIGSTLNTSTDPLPVKMRITYTLDGNEISATDLAGKSGHVTIKYDFTATASYQGKLVPFLTVTGVSLDNTKFTNIKVDNGKILDETLESTLLAGYTFAGLNEDLGTDFLPDSFTISANVTDFALGTTYTFATNDLIADLDTSGLSSIDSLINSMNDLAAGLDQIISGSSSLASGLDSAFTGANKLAAGAHSLADGINDLKDGASQISDGLATVVDFHSEILNQVDTATATITAKFHEFVEKHHLDPEAAAELVAPVVDFYNQVYSGAITYADGIAQLSDGAARLYAGTEQLYSGATELSLGLDSLASGLDALATGSHTLYDGLVTFKTSGIDRLVNFANHDLSGFLYNLRRTVTAADSYHHYSNPSATSVKFIFKTLSIK